MYFAQVADTPLAELTLGTVDMANHWANLGTLQFPIDAGCLGTLMGTGNGDLLAAHSSTIDDDAGVAIGRVDMATGRIREEWRLPAVSWQGGPVAGRSCRGGGTFTSS